jgi:hypothetical protein
MPVALVAGSPTLPRARHPHLAMTGGSSETKETLMPGISSSDESSDPIFQPFSWHNEDVPPSYLKTLAEHSHDVGNGIATLLALIEFSESEALDGKPLLSPLDKGTLLRLAITSSKLLAHFSYMKIARANRVQES